MKRIAVLVVVALFLAACATPQEYPPDKCPFCKGSGIRTCDRCEGKGVSRVETPTGAPRPESPSQPGQRSEELCPKCRGNKTIPCDHRG